MAREAVAGLGEAGETGAGIVVDEEAAAGLVRTGDVTAGLGEAGEAAAGLVQDGEMAAGLGETGEAVAGLLGPGEAAACSILMNLSLLMSGLGYRSKANLIFMNSRSSEVA